MKKNLLTLVVLAGFTTANAQWVQTGGSVVVKPNTVKHVSGTQKITGASSAKESNEGRVYVGGDFTVEGTGTEFRNEWTDAQNYGQLIIDDAATTSTSGSGTMVGEFKDTPATQFYTQPIAVPFKDVTASILATQTGISSPQFIPFTTPNTYDNNRYKNPILTWNNEAYRLDIVNNTSTALEPQRSYNINNGFYNLGIRSTDYKGTPANGTYTYAGTAFTVGDNTDVNYYGEAYYTYLDDLTQSMPTGWNTNTTVSAAVHQDANGIAYASNLYRFANPYTSNIDLSKIPNLQSVVKNVFQFGGNSYTANVSSNSQGVPVSSANWNGTAWGGDGLQALLVRPFHTFGFKTTGDFTFNVGDNIKTWDATGAMSYVNRNGQSLLTQVKLELYNNEGKVNHFYVDAADGYLPAAGNNNETYDIYLGNREGVFTLQENADGSVAQELAHNKVYTNGINKDNYVGLPIHVVHQVVTPGEFTFKANLSDGLLTGRDKFYFEDTQTGYLAEIQPDFVYNFTANETSSDRFNIYWRETPTTLSVKDVSLSQTKVYKDIDSTYKVRFSSDWTSADIYVYNTLGQLIHVARKVNTSVDYKLPLSTEASAYIVKAVGDNGEMKTSKIVKK